MLKAITAALLLTTSVAFADTTCFNQVDPQTGVSVPVCSDSVKSPAAPIAPQTLGEEILWWVERVGGGFLLLILASGSYFTIPQQHVGIVERFGKYHKSSGAGLHLKAPLIDRVADRVSLQITKPWFKVETKTKDNVFVVLSISVQYRVKPGQEFDYNYKLEEPEKQIEALVTNVIRAVAPRMTLDEVFEKKGDIASEVKTDLEHDLAQYGIEIVGVLVTEVDPAAAVKAAMNEIQAQQRLQVAAAAKGEANKILAVKAAEAEAASKKLQGEGIANQRKAIIDGLKESVEQFSEATGSKAEDVMMLVMMTQYFDTMREMGAQKVVFMPHQPAGLSAIAQQIREAIVSAGEAK